MANLNKVMLIGNLTADPEVRPTQSGVPLTELRLAVNRVLAGRGDGERREETTFLDVTCWNRTAEIAAQYLSKGSSVFIEGRLQQDTWEDKQTGQRRSKIRVVAENMQLIDRREGGSQGGGYQQRNNYNNNGGGYQQRNNYNNGGGYQQRGNYGNNGGYQQQAPAPQQPAPQQAPAPQQPPAPMPNEGEDDIPF